MLSPEEWERRWNLLRGLEQSLEKEKQKLVSLRNWNTYPTGCHVGCPYYNKVVHDHDY